MKLSLSSVIGPDLSSKNLLHHDTSVTISSMFSPFGTMIFLIQEKIHWSLAPLKTKKDVWFSSRLCLFQSFHHKRSCRTLVLLSTVLSKQSADCWVLFAKKKLIQKVYFHPSFGMRQKWKPCRTCLSAGCAALSLNPGVCTTTAVENQTNQSWLLDILLEWSKMSNNRLWPGSCRWVSDITSQV